MTNAQAVSPALLESARATQVKRKADRLFQPIRPERYSKKPPKDSSRVSIDW
jgi:hypothetical protein